MQDIFRKNRNQNSQFFEVKIYFVSKSLKNVKYRDREMQNKNREKHKINRIVVIAHIAKNFVETVENIEFHF